MITKHGPWRGNYQNSCGNTGEIVKFLLMKNITFYFFLGFILIGCGNNKKPDILLLADRVDNLTVNSEVKVNGLVVGQVINMQLLDNGVLVSLNFKKPTKISVDSDFKIISPLVGLAYVSITPGTEKALLTIRDTARGFQSSTKPLDKLLTDSTTKKKINEVLDKIINGFDSLHRLRKDTSNNHLNN